MRLRSHDAGGSESWLSVCVAGSRTGSGKADAGRSRETLASVRLSKPIPIEVT